MSEDPIRFQGGINFFAYVSNMPINDKDPLGLVGHPVPIPLPPTPPPSGPPPCVYGCHSDLPPAPPYQWTKEQKMRVCEIDCHLGCEIAEHLCGVYDWSTSMSTCALGCFYLCHSLVGD